MKALGDARRTIWPVADGRAVPALLDDDAGTTVPVGAGTVVFSGVSDGTPSMYTLTSGNGAIRGGTSVRPAFSPRVTALRIWPSSTAQ